MREIVVAGAQMGPIQKAEPREAVVERMLALMEEAHSAGCDLVVYPELCLTTFFPRWYFEKQAEVDSWFEKICLMMLPCHYLKNQKNWVSQYLLVMRN